MKKKCTKCGIPKHYDEFVKNKNVKSGIGSVCKECVRNYSKKRYETHSHVWKNWWEENKAESINKHKEWVKNNEEKVKEYMSNYMTIYSNNKYKNDINYKLQKVLRSRLYVSLKNEYKKTSATELVGCSLEKLKQHLESQFTSKMNWENYGTYWEIDHIKQIFSFDLKELKNQKKCFNYKNLRPLEKDENRRRPKKNKVVEMAKG